MNKNEWVELEQRISKDYSNIAGIVITKDGVSVTEVNIVVKLLKSNR